MLLILSRSILCLFWPGSIISYISIKIRRIVAVQYTGAGTNIQGYNPQNIQKHIFQGQTFGISGDLHVLFYGSKPYFSQATDLGEHLCQTAYFCKCGQLTPVLSRENELKSKLLLVFYSSHSMSFNVYLICLTY